MEKLQVELNEAMWNWNYVCDMEIYCVL